MTKLLWDQSGQRFYETGVDRGVLYIPNVAGIYNTGYAWNGLTTVTESPAGAESTPQYADNIQYLNLISNETFGGTIEAFTYPDAFAQCDGSLVPYAGVSVGQQARKSFGLSYRTRVGNDISADSLGYKLHLVYGALAAPSEKANATVNDTPAALAFSWDFTTSPVDTGITGARPTSILTIDSTKVPSANLAALETLLYGAAGVDPALPTPAAVIALFAGSITPVSPTAPTYNVTTHIITIPTVTGVTYWRQDTGVAVTAATPITLTTGQQLVISATANAGYQFPPETDDDWQFNY